jgi:hypothetical protein
VEQTRDALKKAVLKKHKLESGPETFALTVNCSVTPNSTPAKLPYCRDDTVLAQVQLDTKRTGHCVKCFLDFPMERNQGIL